MTLTLTHDEVQQYFDTQADLTYSKQKVIELEDEIAMLRQEYSAENSVAPSITITKDYLPDISTVIAAYEEGETRDDRQGKTWDDIDIHIIRMSVGKAHDAFRISSLASILGRTVQSINSKAHDLGFIVKNDRVVYKHD